MRVFDVYRQSPRLISVTPVKSLRLIAVMTTFLLANLAPPTSGQDSDEEDYLKKIPMVLPIVFHINDNATYYLHHEEEIRLRIHFPPRYDELILLNKEWVQGELGMTAAQKNHYEDVFNNVLNLSHLAKINATNFRPPVPADLTNGLDQRQQARFRELVIRCRIRTMGITKFFCQPSLGLSNDELAAIERLLSELEPVYKEKIAELRESTIEAILKPLNTDQRQKLSEMSAGFLETHRHPLPMLRWQLENLDSFRETIADRTHPEYRWIFLQPEYRVCVDGTVAKGIYVFEDDERKTMTEQERFEYERKIPKSILNAQCMFLYSDTARTELQLTDSQLELLKKVYSEYRAPYDEFSKISTQNLKDRQLPQEEIYQLYRDCEREQLELALKLLPVVDNIYLPHQREILKLYCLLLEFIRGGPVDALIHGQLGRRLEITTSQKKDIETAAGKAAEEMNTRLREWEDEVFKKLKGTLSEDSQKRLKDIFAKTPQRGPSSLEAMLKSDQHGPDEN